MQLDNAHKGFSFMQDGPLDMRMNPDNPLTAKDVIAKFSEKELGQIFQDYGEEPRWKASAKAIVEERKKNPITTTKQLADLLVTALRTKLRGRLHPATLVFQALRIFVNKEIEVLEKTIDKAITFLSPKGIIGIISFHSFEDRVVKNVLREASKQIKDGYDRLPAPLTLLTKKPLVPSLQEIRSNIRARSAKLRFAQKN